MIFRCWPAISCASTIPGPCRGSAAFPDASMNAMLAYHWPGNVRELENAVNRAIVLATADEIGRRSLDLLPPRCNAASGLRGAGARHPRRGRAAALADRARCDYRDTCHDRTATAPGPRRSWTSRSGACATNCSSMPRRASVRPARRPGRTDTGSPMGAMLHANRRAMTSGGVPRARANAGRHNDRQLPRICFRRLRRGVPVGDASLGLGVMLLLGILIVPIPTFLLDFALALSFTASILILLVSLSLKTPWNFPACRLCCCC